MRIAKEEVRLFKRALQTCGACAISAAMVATMAVPFASAAVSLSNGYGVNPSTEILLTDGSSSIPSAEAGDVAKSYDDYIIGGSGGSGTASCDYVDVLGIDNVSNIGYNWSTKINQNPNSFGWNYALGEQVDTTQQTSDSTALGYSKSGWSGTLTYATVDEYRPDVLASNSTSSYEQIVATIQEADGNTDYNPIIVNFAEGFSGIGLTVINDFLWNIGVAVEALDKYVDYDEYMALSDEEKEGKATTRYGSPTAIAQKYTEYFQGIQWYILSKYEQAGELKTIAYISAYSDGEATVKVYDPTYESGATQGDSVSRTLEGLSQVTYNVATAEATASAFTYSSQSAAIQTYTTTDMSVFKDVDVVFYAASSGGGNSGSGNSGSGSGGDMGSGGQAPADDDEETTASFEDVIKAQGFTGEFYSGYSIAIGNQGFGFVRNYAEVICTVYPEDLNLSYMLYYFWYELGHVKAEYVQAVMENQDASKLMPASMTADESGNYFDVSGYTDSYVHDMAVIGEKYFLAHYADEDSFCYNQSSGAYGNIKASTAYQFISGATAGQIYEYQVYYYKTYGVEPYGMSDYLQQILDDITAALAGDEASAEVIASLTDYLEILETTVEELTASNETLSTELAAAVAKAESLSTQVASLTGEVTDLEEQVESLEKEVADLEKQVSSLESTLSSTESNASANVELAASLLKEAQAELAATQEELETAQADLAAAQAAAQAELAAAQAAAQEELAAAQAAAKVQTIELGADSVKIKKGKKATVKVCGAKGTITAKSTKTKVATVSVKNGKIVVKAKKKGTCKIKVSCAATSTYDASETVILKVKVTK